MTFLLIDNYDSFTYNLYHYLCEIGVSVNVVRNDALSAAEALEQGTQGIILSPGPCTPNESGICPDVLRLAAQKNVPVLGVCLGHQVLGQVFGGQVIRAPVPVHGKIDAIFHRSEGVFKNLPSPFMATRYHSLIVDKASLPETLYVTAENKDGLIMGLRHNSKPLYGVQFHPESIASQYGLDLLKNFAELCR
jgi:anthranilate synthase/aminodeoxychorismate synthase-like glutamine amidotransferase